MKTQIYPQTYTVKEMNYRGKTRYHVTINGDLIGSLHYAKRNFAMKKAYEFITALYKDFYRDCDDTQVCFEFKQV